MEQVSLEQFDVFCRDIIAHHRIDIGHIYFENETDREVFVIKHLVMVMHALYNGIRDYGRDEECNQLKPIASRHLERYTHELYQSLNH